MGRRGSLTFLALGELLSMGLWFSATAVVPQLTEEWNLTGTEKAWMTMSVQAGFVAGALLSAFLNLADRMSNRRLVLLSSLAGATFNALIPVLDGGPSVTIGLRFLNGMVLAGVYPPGMKLIASWTTRDRGQWIGILVGAITFGSALPHLLNAVPFLGANGMPPWRPTLLVSSAMAAIGGLLVGGFVRPGPYVAQSAPFDWRYAGRSFSHKPTRLANFGYLGHMWELYAMWAWTPIFLIASYERAGFALETARLAGFAVVAMGAVGSIIAGVFADRIGRTTVTIISLVISGACCLLVGGLFAHPVLLTVLCLIWGLAVVADSAQFSAAVSELSDPRYVGTALTVQTSLGFLLTMVTLQLVPSLLDWLGWERVFFVLVVGPVFAIWSMARLRGLPEAVKMASGNR